MDDNLYIEVKSLADIVINQNENINNVNNQIGALIEIVKAQTMAINNLIIAYNQNAMNTNESLAKINSIANKLSDMEVKNSYTDDEIRTNNDKLSEINSAISETKNLLEKMASQIPYRWESGY